MWIYYSMSRNTSDVTHTTRAKERERELVYIRFQNLELFSKYLLVFKYLSLTCCFLPAYVCVYITDEYYVDEEYARHRRVYTRLQRECDGGGWWWCGQVLYVPSNCNFISRALGYSYYIHHKEKENSM